MKEQMQATGFQIIATVGEAKSLFMEAIYKAKENKIDEAKELIKKGEGIFSNAHTMHFELVQKEAQGEDLPFSLLFMHAEDQLLSTETIKIMAIEMIDLYEKIN